MPMPSTAHKVMPRGFQIRGSNSSATSATVPYLVTWANAFTFIDEVMGTTTGATLPPTTTQPHKYPNTGTIKLYADDYTCEPCGSDGQPEPTNKGLLPGEFFTHAKIVVTYKTPEQVRQTGDDPSGFLQLDPANPITLCEQSVRMSAKMVTKKAGSYEFDTGEPVVGHFAAQETETELVLTFPRVPRLPWQFLRPYIGKVSSAVMFGCPIGNLLLLGSDIKYTSDSGGDLKTMAQLVFAVQHDDRDWNELQRPDGTYGLVRRRNPAGGSSLSGGVRRIYEYADHRNIFS